MTYDAINTAARVAGLIVMGALHPAKTGAKALDHGTLVLLGAGPAFWPAFVATDEYRDEQADPVDRWSKRIIGAMAQQLGAKAYFPSDGPPYAPFIDWALKSGRFHSSPIGMMVHDKVGLMISIRGALHLPQETEVPEHNAPSPCNTCAAPCTSACPVDALQSEHPYNIDACYAHLRSPQGQSCMTGGCHARLACPLSDGAGRTPEQSALHMQAFLPS